MCVCGGGDLPKLEEDNEAKDYGECSKKIVT